VTGALQLQNASLFLPETGAHLAAINLSVQANRADQLLITGTVKVGEGILNVNGKLALAQLPKWKADMTLSGKRLLLMNTHEVQAYVFTPNSLEFYSKMREFVRELVEAAKSAGRANYNLAIGCTGGQHRSVAVVEKLAIDLADSFNPQLNHRDLEQSLTEHSRKHA